MLFKSMTGRSPRQAIRKYRSYISNVVDDQMLAEAEKARLHQLLLYEIDQDTPELLAAAGRTDRAGHIDHSRQVLARATLLLRVATGSLANLLDDSNAVFRSDLVFWWSGPSVRRRLWAKNGCSACL